MAAQAKNSSGQPRKFKPEAWPLHLAAARAVIFLASSPNEIGLGIVDPLIVQENFR
jgi:hypothetical protein